MLCKSWGARPAVSIRKSPVISMEHGNICNWKLVVNIESCLMTGRINSWYNGSTPLLDGDSVRIRHRFVTKTLLFIVIFNMRLGKNSLKK